MKKILLIVLGVILVAFVGWRIAAARAPKIAYDTFDAARQTLRQTVQVTGEVVSSQDVDLKFEASGRVHAIIKKVGDPVKAGEVLATLDGRDEAVGVQKAQAALLSAQASLDRLQHGATAEDINVAAVAAENAQTSLDQAQLSLTRTQASNAATLDKAYGDLDGQIESLYLKASSAVQTMKNEVFDAAGSLRSDISSSDSGTQNQALTDFTAARSAITAMDMDVVAYRAATTDADKDRLSGALLGEAKTVRQSAQTANALMQTSVPTGATTQAAFDARKSDVKAAWSELSAAVNAADSQRLLVASTAASNASSLSAAEQNVKTAEGALASAQANLDLKKAPATSFDLESARASVSQAQASLGEAENALEKTKIRAPFDGTIAQVPGRAGTTVAPSDVILKLHGDNLYEIEADVPETDVAKLKIGLPAEITLDAYGDGVKFQGALTSIDTAQTVIQDVVYYKTRFQLQAQADKPIRTGMTANITVITQEKANVLVVPQRAIRLDGEEKSVRVLENGQEVKKVVTTGLYGDDGYVEIVSGLSGGEKIVLAARRGGKIITE